MTDPHRSPNRRAVLRLLLVVALALAGCASAGPSGAALEGAAAPDEAARSDGAVAHGRLEAALDGCETWPAPEGGVMIECSHRGVSLRIERFDIDVATLRSEVVAGSSELVEVAPLEALEGAAAQLVVRLAAGPGADAAAGLVAVAEMADGTFLGSCSQRFDAVATPFDEPWCRAALRLLLEDGGRSLLPPLSEIDFVGRSVELDAAGCWAEAPGTITCNDGAQLSWTTASAERVEELLAQSAESARLGLIGSGAARPLDRQSPACRIDDAEATRCEVVRLASGRDVIIAVFAAATLRERHVFVECSYAVDDAGPELDAWLPPVCADILTVVP